MSSPISVHPDNPHYFFFQGKPLVLLTSDQHYGAVVNVEFDYTSFLDKLKSKDLNFTRIYPGAYIEKEDEYTPGNPLGACSGQFILPWATTSETGVHPILGSRKFDLDQWDQAYFNRLGDFCAKALDRGIIIEICFFNGMYAHRWEFQAMYYQNNIQCVGTCTWDMVQSLTGDPNVVSYQEKYIAEITRRLNDFDNIIYHICDEPWQCEKSPDIMGAWMDRMIEAFRKGEDPLPKKHLLGQTVDWTMRNNSADFSADSRIQYIDIEYSRGADDLKNEYVHKKPVVYIETVFYPDEYGGDKIGATRVEAWEFMLGGCAGFMQLNALYKTANAAAQGTGIDEVLDVFVTLKTFLAGFDLFAMNRDNAFIVSGVPSDAFASAISEPGRQYGFYIHHSVYKDPPPKPGDIGSFRHSYVVTQGLYHETFTFNFPAGRYAAEWIDPATGAVKQKDSIVHEGGDCKLTAPDYSIDIALRMKNL
jgi:hypothetical protein